MSDSKSQEAIKKKRRAQLEHAVALRRAGHSYREVSEQSGVGSATVRFWCARMGTEEELIDRVALQIDGNKALLQALSQGESFIKLAKIHNIRPAYALKSYCMSRGIFSYTAAGRREKLRRSELAEVHRLGQEGVSAEDISKKVNWSLYTVRRALDQSVVQPQKRYWDRRGRPHNLSELYHKKGQTQALLAKELDCTIVQLNVLLKEHGLQPRVSQRSPGLTSSQTETITKSCREGASLGIMSKRGECTPRVARLMLMGEGLINQDTVDGWIKNGFSRGRSLYSMCWSVGMRIDELTNELFRLGLVPEPYSRPFRIDLGVSKSYRKVLTDSQRRKAIESKLYHRIDISANRFPDIEKIKMTLLRARQFRHDKTVTKEYFDNLVYAAYYDPQFSAVYCAWVSDKQKDLTPSIDHVIPRSAGGSDHPSNIQFLTWFENRSKAAMTLHEWQAFKIKHQIKCSIFIEELMTRHHCCSCQDGCSTGFFASSFKRQQLTPGDSAQ